MNIQSTARTGMVFSIASTVILLVMFVMGAGISGQMDVLGLPGLPEKIVKALQPAAQRLIAMIAVDNLFLIAYTGTFLAGAALFWDRVKLFGLLALFFAALLALLDLGENALIIHMARSAAAGSGLTAGQITGLALVEQVKYGSATLALVFIGAGMLIGGPVRSGLQKAMAASFFLFGPVNAIKIVAPGTSLLLVFWMLVMLVVSGLYFRQVMHSG